MAKCGYSHHKEAGQPAPDADMGQCPKCKGDLVCGPFYHKVCPKCDKAVGRSCGICRDPVYLCCC